MAARTTPGAGVGTRGQSAAPVDREGKRPFDIDVVVERVRAAVRPLPKAAMFALAEQGHDSLFEQLVACIISIRTRDEVSGPAARHLFSRARTPEEVLRLTAAEIAGLIKPSMFRDGKAVQILEIARRAVEQYGGTLPCDYDVLTAFAGVGPKCANLALGIACHQPRVSVDVHVHRVTNRWGYVHTGAPEATMLALQEKLPRRYWIEINSLLVPFGKHICTGALPHCSTCPVLDMCRQVGVTSHR